MRLCTNKALLTKNRWGSGFGPQAVVYQPFLLTIRCATRPISFVSAALVQTLSPSLWKWTPETKCFLLDTGYKAGKKEEKKSHLHGTYGLVGATDNKDKSKMSGMLDIYIFFVFCLFRAAPSAYGGSQARGLIRAIPPGLCHGHSNAGSEPSLRPTPQLTATPDP